MNFEGSLNDPWHCEMLKHFKSCCCFFWFFLIINFGCSCFSQMPHWCQCQPEITQHAGSTIRYPSPSHVDRIWGVNHPPCHNHNAFVEEFFLALFTANTLSSRQDVCANYWVNYVCSKKTNGSTLDESAFSLKLLDKKSSWAHFLLYGT